MSSIHIGSNIIDVVRCELADIYSTLRIIECMRVNYNIESINIELGSGCEGDLTQMLLESNKTSLQYVHGTLLDLINSINSIKHPT